MVDYQTISIVLTGIGLIIALTYYSLQIRNQNRTRQSQLFMQVYQEMVSTENFKILNELINMEFNDFPEYIDKYGSENNPDAFSKRYSTWYRFHGIGLLVRNGLIDVDRVFELMNELVLWQWNKFGDMIIESRDYYNLPDWMEGFEYLAYEFRKLKTIRGHSPEVPEKFGRHISTEERQ